MTVNNDNAITIEEIEAILMDLDNRKENYGK